MSSYLRALVVISVFFRSHASHLGFADHMQLELTNSQGVRELEFRIVTRDGLTKWISHICQPVYTDSGNYWGRRVTHRDITERKHIEDTLRLHHERFVTVLDSIEASIYVADLDTYEVLFMNKHMIERFGKDMTGSTCWKSFKNATVPCPWCLESHALDQGSRSTGGHSW